MGFFAWCCAVAELLSSLWQQVVVHPPPEEELPLLLSSSFPAVTPFISPVLGTGRTPPAALTSPWVGGPNLCSCCAAKRSACFE